MLDFARTARLAKILQGTRLCRANPALCSQVVREMAAQGDMHTLYVPKDAFEQIAQGRGTTLDALLAQMPETQANGSLLAIPAHEYFTALPEGMAGDLSPLAKTDPARSSLAEVVEQARRPEREAADRTSSHNEAAINEEQASSSPPDAGGAEIPSPDVVPGGGLEAHEKLGGHLLEKHSGRTKAQLEKRLQDEPQRDEVSTFFTHAVAEKAAAATIKENEAKIAEWLKTNNPKLVISATMKHPIGFRLARGATALAAGSGVKLVLKRNANAPLGYFILTGMVP